MAHAEPVTRADYPARDLATHGAAYALFIERAPRNARVTGEIATVDVATDIDRRAPESGCRRGV